MLIIAPDTGSLSTMTKSFNHRPEFVYSDPSWAFNPGGAAIYCLIHRLILRCRPFSSQCPLLITCLWYHAYLLCTQDISTVLVNWNHKHGFGIRNFSKHQFFSSILCSVPFKEIYIFQFHAKLILNVFLRPQDSNRKAWAKCKCKSLTCIQQDMNACVRGLMTDPQHRPFSFTHCMVEIQFCAIFTECSRHNTVALRHFIKCWAESPPIADSISGRVHSKGVLQAGFAPAAEIACCIKGLVKGTAEEILLLSGSSSF